MDKGVGVKLDVTEFSKWARRTHGLSAPKFMVETLSDVTRSARDTMRGRIYNVFKLRSGNYIPNSVLNVPELPNQVRAATKAMTREGGANGAVFVPTRANPRKSLKFLDPHEFGEDKVGRGKSRLVAVPARDLKNYAYRTGRGAIRSRWKPKRLLEAYNSKGPNTKGAKQHSRKRSKSPGDAFILKGRGNTELIARRSTKNRRPLEILYVLTKRANIEPVLDFDNTVEGVITSELHSKGIAAFNKTFR